MKIDIRAASPGDIPVLLALIKKLAEFEKLAHQVEATPERLRATLFPERGAPAAEFLLARADGEPVGYAALFPTYSTFLAKAGLHLEDLFVVEEWRGRGIGRALLSHAASLAAGRGCGRLEWTVLDWNRPAIDFYASMGADTLPDWRVCRLSGDALARHA
ncbi:MAG TPA: GNAT family N-acetyltransferase [Opitutaceae bacterium]|jgi:hypothetical protein